MRSVPSPTRPTAASRSRSAIRKMASAAIRRVRSLIFQRRFSQTLLQNANFVRLPSRESSAGPLTTFRFPGLPAASAGPRLGEFFAAAPSSEVWEQEAGRPPGSAFAPQRLRRAGFAARGYARGGHQGGKTTSILFFAGERYRVRRRPQSLIGYSENPPNRADIEHFRVRISGKMLRRDQHMHPDLGSGAYWPS